MNARLSYCHGANEVPLLGKTIGQALDDAAEAWGERLALVSCEQSVRLSWRALKARSDAFAAGLRARGLTTGDRIGIWSLNRVEWAVTQFAAAKAGLVLVTINPAYRLSELEFALNRVGCKALVIAPPFKSSDYPRLITQLAPELASCLPGELLAEKVPELRLVVQMGVPTVQGANSFDDIEASGTDDSRRLVRELEQTLQFDDAVNIQFTSGTTGSPKGVTLSHFNILNNGFFVGRALGLTADDRVCIPVPLYHCFGMVMGNLACVTHGASMIYPGQGFDPLRTLQAVSEERCTVLYGVPTMFIAQLEHQQFEEFNTKCLRTGIMAGAPCPIEIMRRVNDLMNMREITICYGMTETSPVSYQSSRSDSLEVRATTVGHIHPHIESKIVDAEGRIVARGATGEICTRGYSVMLGYWHDAEQTAEVIDAAGWMHTGDLGSMDSAGNCTIVGRIKDMVIRGGENLYPREIEEFLYGHPAIRDVQVFGVTDEKYGEELCAWIILQESGSMDAHALQAYCQDQIAHQKIPRYVRFVDAFPMTVTGKPQKFAMRESMESELRSVKRPPRATGTSESA